MSWHRQRSDRGLHNGHILPLLLIIAPTHDMPVWAVVCALPLHHVLTVHGVRWLWVVISGCQSGSLLGMG